MAKLRLKEVSVLPLGKGPFTVMEMASTENVEATIFISVTVVSIGIVTPVVAPTDLSRTGLGAAPPMDELVEADKIRTISTRDVSLEIERTTCPSVAPAIFW